MLRTSLALSLITGQPFEMVQVRANRSQPGLRPQHLMAVKAAQAIGRAEVTGDQVGSSHLTFTPGTVTAGDYHFAIGTAGSTTLVLQTIFPPLLLASGPSTVTLEGGTHNAHAPPFEFLDRVFVPIINRMGPSVSVRLEQYGFYPVGKGRILAAITPSAGLQPIEILERGPLERQAGWVVSAHLPQHIAEREVDVLARSLDWSPALLHTHMVSNSISPGNVVFLEAHFAHIAELVTSMGARGVPAEMVARQAAAEMRAYLAHEGAVGEHLADQLLLPLALAGGGTYTTGRPSRHTTTNMDVIRQFLPVQFDVSQHGTHWRITVLR